MKTFILVASFLFSGVALAQSRPIFPQIFNFGNSIQLQYYNPNPNTFFCSGSITMGMYPSGTEVHFSNEIVAPGAIVTRHIWPRQANVRIANVFHSIYCR